MKRKIIVTRMAAFLLAAVLVLNNEQVMYALAEGDNSAGWISDVGGTAPSGDESITQAPAGSSQPVASGNNGEGGGSGSSQPAEPGDNGEGGGSGSGQPAEPGDNGEGGGSGSGQPAEPGDNGEGGGSGSGQPAEPGDNEGGENGSNGNEGENNPGDENKEECVHEWVTDPETQKTICSKCGVQKADESGSEGENNSGDENKEECVHEWVTDPETQKTTCSKCGKERTEEDEAGTGDEEVCEHEWITDPDTLLVVCSKCGIEWSEEFEKPEEECEHQWMREPETLRVICGICGEYNEEYVEEDECPEGGFHIYDFKEDGTGWICVVCGAEKETLGELDVTLEMYIYAMEGQVSPLVEDPDNRAYSKLPKTLADLAALKDKELIVASLGDLLVVQDLSKMTDFEGYTIRISRRTIASSSVGQNTWDLQGIADFEGLGNAEHPFKGTLESAYTNGSLVYMLDKPLFQYLSTDAVVKEMSMIGSVTANENTPKGVLAGVLVKGERDTGEMVTLQNVAINGEVSNTGGAAGLAFGRVENKTESSIRLSFNKAALRLANQKILESTSGTASGIHVGAVAGEIVGNVILEINDPEVLGDITVKSTSVWSNSDNESGQLEWDKTSAGGMYAGAIDGGTVIIEGNSNAYAVNVQRASGNGGANGGFIGMAIGTDISTNASSGLPVTVSGSGVVGRISGGILGYYDRRDDRGNLQLDYINVDTPVSAEGGDNYFAGGILGRYYRNEDGAADGVFHTINHVIISRNVSATYYAGGVAGVVHGSNLRIGGEDAESILVTGNVTNSTGWGNIDNACGAGGIVGLVSGQYIEIQNAVVRTNFHQNVLATGGIVGTVGKIKPGFNDNGRSSILKIKDVTVDSNFGINGENSDKYRGGVLGIAFPGSMVALDGKIEVNMNPGQPLRRAGRIGHIAGCQKEALVYFETGAAYTRPEGKNWVDDIGNYGGVYRNGTWGESDPLISYEEGKVKGVVGGSGNSWVIDSEADFIRLAVMLNSQGNFAADCFGSTTKADLLAGEYSVTKSLDLKNSGVYSLNRNDSVGFNEQFTGKFTGSGSGSVTIDLGELKTRQSYLALFPTTGSGAEFSGFKLVRSIDGASLYAAGITCKALGTFTAKDLDLRVGIRSYYYDDTSRFDEQGRDLHAGSVMHYYAALAAYVDSQGDTVFTANQIKVGGIFNEAVNYDRMRMGSMIAEYVQTGTAPSKIVVNNFELMGDYSLTSQGAFAGGMICLLNHDTNNFADQTKISMSNLVIHNGAAVNHQRNDGAAMGGWLGRVWKNVVPDEEKSYSIDGITIGDGGTRDAGPQYASNGLFGGLVDTVTGRLQLKNINIQNGIFNNRSSRDRIGLLFRVGNNALIEIDGYRIDGREIGDLSGANNGGNVQIINCDGKNFDEIVAYNIGNYTDVNNHNVNGYKNGGIVNIIYNGFSDTASAGHLVYQNRLLTSNNDRTRYYYNLFGNSFEGEGSYLSDAEKLTYTGTTVTNAKQMMIWHLSQYMNDSIRGYLTPYYVGGNINEHSQDTTFKGTIDLEKVSYYPTSVLGGTYTFTENAIVKFYGQDITDKATAAMTPSSDKKEHYMMHSGLFISETGNVTVKGGTDSFLTLTGSVTNLGANSGALFSGTIQGKKEVYFLKLDSLAVADYDPANYPGDNHEVGLLIGIVNDRLNNSGSHGETLLDMSWIETTGYDSFSGKAASALIGRVGDAEATKVSVEFKNIQVDSRKDGIFQYASLIDKNYYREDMTENTSSADALRRLRYLYTEAAFKGEDDLDKIFPFNSSNPNYGSNLYNATGPYVTIGSELVEGKGIEFWDVAYGPTEGDTYRLPFITGDFTWNEANVKDTYLPYVHTTHQGSKGIEVNPKNVSITEGCGTYEDPYIIDNPKQLLALARYLQNKNDYKYLGGWQINVYESGRAGGSFCGKVHMDTDVRTYPYNGGTLPDGFPTQEELSQAYYMIAEDIDLSSMSNATDKQIAEDFAGFGTEKMPFRGVIVGQIGSYDDGRTYPKVTLPLRQNWTNSTYDVNHGFIQYAKGVVIKDLLIVGAEAKPGDTERTGVVKVSNMAGGAIGCVLGGDNIIDNVSVQLEVALTSKDGQAGAYVGNVRQGSVILRNLKEDSVNEFSVGQWNAGNALYKEFGSRDLDEYPYVSGLIGKVEDGCVIYEDNFTGAGSSYNDAPILNHEAVSITGIYGNWMKLPICKHYDIIVKSHLDQGNTDLIKVSGNAGAGFTAQVDTAAQLQIVSMTINSDAFSVYYDNGGYAQDAVCRKAKYSDVGNINDSNSGAGSDWAHATKEDDKIYYYPYLYTYFDFTGVTGDRAGTFITKIEDGKTVYTSQLNAATTEVTAVMNYNLKAADYDMSIYCRGFRGLGATYGMFTNNAAASNKVVSDSVKPANVSGGFYSDFRANFNGNGACIKVAIDRTYDDSIHTAALFNDLLDRTANEMYTIQNVTVSGSVCSVVRTQNGGNDTTDGNTSYPNRTGGVIGLMRRPWKLTNVVVKDMEINAMGHAGGIVAWIEPESGKEAAANVFDFEKCAVEENTQINSYGGSAGGIVGVVTQNDKFDAFNANLNLKGCKVTGTLGKEVTIEVKNRTADRNDGDLERNSQMAAGRSGGLVGYIGRRFLNNNNNWYKNLSVQVTIDKTPDDTVCSTAYANITGAYSTGGMIGEYDAVYGVNGSNSHSSVIVKNGKVENCVITGTRGNIDTRDDYYDYGVGGFIGQMRGNSLKMGEEGDVIVLNTNVISSAASGNGMYAGGVVGCLKTLTSDITNVQVTGTIGNSLKADLELGGQQYMIRSERADAGGVIGRTVGEESNPAPMLTMSGVQISGIHIVVDDWKKDGAGSLLFQTSAVVSGNAGGMIGTNEVKLEISGNDAQPESGAKVENCMIATSGGNAGGIAGCLYKSNNNNVFVRPTTIQNVVIKNNIIGYNNLARFTGNNTDYGAGGIFGKIFSTKNGDEVNAGSSMHRLEKTQISGCWIYGPSAGGVLGHAKGTTICSNEIGNETDISVEVKENKIYGICVGGAIGNYQNSAMNYIGMSISDNRLQAYRNTANDSPFVGGFCGYINYANANSNYSRLDYIKIRNNHILAANTSGNKFIRAGGFFGYTNSNNYVYQPELTDNLIGYSESTNGGVLVSGTGGTTGQPGQAVLQALFNSTAGEISAGTRTVFLIKGTNQNSYTTQAMPSVTDLRNNKTGYYAGGIGNFVGNYGTSFNTTYFLAPKLSYKEDIAVRPVIDVGMNPASAAGTTDTETLLGAPYAYRNYIHIVYHDVAQPIDADAEVWNGISNIEGSTADNWQYLFDGISYQGIIEGYKKTETTNSLSEYLNAYRLNMKVEQSSTENVEGVYEKLYRDQEGKLVTPLTLKSGTTFLPAIALDTQYGDADQLIRSVVAALTGVGGIYSSDDSANGSSYSNAMGAITKIETKPMQINTDGTISAVAGEPANLSAVKDGNKWRVDYEDYDNDGADGKPQTFTLLTITYSWKYTPCGQTSEVERKEVVRIPVYVMVRLGIDTHLKIMEDLVYNADKVKEDGMYSSVTIANDSSFTLYSEYIYDSARKKYQDVQVDKKVGMTNAEGKEVGFAKGTKLTLIDVSDNNKVYYYTVKDNDPGPYYYTSFEDEEGNPYVNKKIGEDKGFDIYGKDETFETTDMADDGKPETFIYSDVAVERFLITVDISDVKKEDRIDTESRTFGISPTLSEDLEKRTTLENHTDLLAQIQPGINISFYQKRMKEEEEKTWIEGNIKADENGIVNVWAAIDIRADALYWSAVEQNGDNTIDSANSNKYLELQTYLTMPDGQEIALPDGTNVFVWGERTQPVLSAKPGEIEETGLGAYHDASNIYFYKDGNLHKDESVRIKLDDLLDLILEDGAEHGSSDGVIRWMDRLRIDFRNADMTPYDEEKYNVNLRLLRVENPEYPAAGEELDTYSQEIPAARKYDLACAVETKDLMQLGINIYENQTSMPHTILFDFKLDFSGVLTGNDATDQALTDKQYIVAYRLLEKVNTGSTQQYEYVSYMGNQLNLELVEDPDGLSLSTTTSTNPSSSGIPFWYVNYSFDFKEIKNGTQIKEGDSTKEMQSKGVVVRSLKLTVDNAAKMDLSNYKVQAIVFPIDNSEDGTELPSSYYPGLNLNSQTPLSDFFVFTVAKLKTDLDY